MNTRTWSWPVFVLGLMFPLWIAAAELGPQKSIERGVTVTVTPVVLSADAKTWEFKIVLDTHTVALTDELQRTASITAADGRVEQPIAWVGAPPGGHHREGVLRFGAMVPAPEAVELRIQRPDESSPRTFRWPLR